MTVEKLKAPIGEAGTYDLPVMTAVHCRNLLASARVSRVAFVVGGRPRIVVLNHVVDGDRVVFQTSPDTTLAQLTADGAEIAAALEVDSAASSDRSGWSVVATGTVARISAAEVARTPDPWRPEAIGVLLAMTVQEIHGLTVGGMSLEPRTRPMTRRPGDPGL